MASQTATSVMPPDFAISVAAADQKAAMRIILIRHGQPHIESSPRTNHSGFHDYIDAYEEAGLDPKSVPPTATAMPFMKSRRVIGRSIPR